MLVAVGGDIPNALVALLVSTLPSAMNEVEGHYLTTFKRADSALDVIRA